jgi:hypothetical protein
MVALSEVTIFHRLSFYAPRNLAARLVLPADPKLSIIYQRHDTIDRGLLDLNPWFPINTVPWRDFLLNTPSFFEYGYIGRWGWLTYELPHVSGDVRLVARTMDRLLFRVSDVSRSAVMERTSDYRGSTDLPPLFASQPKQGPSLCESWMGAQSCPALR